MNPRTRKMSTCKSTSTEHATQRKVCSINIQNATVDDSGTYYCSAIYGNIIYMGNGSTVIVRKEKSTASPPIEILWSSDKIHRPIVPLTCSVSGVVPQQARVFWVIDGEEKIGLTGSIWTKDGDAVIESTQNRVLVPAEVWDRGAPCTCVVEFDGRNASKSVQRPESGDACAVLLYGAIAGAALLITVTISIAVCLLRGHYVGNHGHAWEPRRAPGTGHGPQHSGSQGSESQTVDNALYKEVQYATLEEASLGRRTNIVLH
ncbi:hypothetical protein AAFF_G00441590 [Aldrovandia affinis]|uniref:Ig-like domain-containing protein n=1 Tax=Aldrovandia affinis TaxID=143900 RepID=A0AAD7S7D5_9TELE|nr:hypothetical protein AAFF_G00441590 [Aldrovandia affinis]